MRYILLISSILLSQYVSGQKYLMDPSFSPAIQFSAFGGLLRGAALDSSQRIVLWGYFEDSSYPNNLHVIRLENSGAVDVTFSQAPGYIPAVAGILNCSKFNSTYFFQVDNDFIIKCDSNGAIYDTTYSYNFQNDNTSFGEVHLPEIIQSERFLFGIDSVEFPPSSGLIRYLMKTNPDGSFDQNFNHNTNEVVKHILTQQNKYKVLLGDFTLYDSISSSFICRIDTNDILDTAFQNPFSNVFSFYNAFLLPDDKIFISGLMQLPNSVDTIQFIRLNPNGTIDSTFNNNISIFDQSLNHFGVIVSVCTTKDSGFLIGGSFTHIDGILRNNIARINYDGTLDLLEFNGTGVDSSAGNNIGLYPSVSQIIYENSSGFDKYYILGYFNSYYNAPVENIFRLIVDSTVNINEISVPSSFNIYPNPSSGQIFVESADHKIERINWTISNSLNFMVMHGDFNSNRKSINVHNLRSGLYFLNLFDNGSKILTKKIIIN